MPTLDTSALPLPTASDVGDALVTAFDTAGDAASMVVGSARKRPALAAGIAATAIVALLAMLWMRRRHRPTAAVRPVDSRRDSAAA